MKKAILALLLSTSFVGTTVSSWYSRKCEKYFLDGYDYSNVSKARDNRAIMTSVGFAGIALFIVIKVMDKYYTKKMCTKKVKS